MAPPMLAASLDAGVGLDIAPAPARTDNGQRSVPIRRTGPWWRRIFSFVGPGYLVAVGYMDPGNWATDLAGGAGYGYALLWIVGLSSAMAMLLQVLSARLGIVAQADLAQLSRKYGSPRTVSARRPSAPAIWPK